MKTRIYAAPVVKGVNMFEILYKNGPTGLTGLGFLSTYFENKNGEVCHISLVFTL